VGAGKPPVGGLNHTYYILQPIFRVNTEKLDGLIMDYLEGNLSVLRESNPGLADTIRDTELTSDYQIFTAKNGLPTIKVRGISLHSGYDPVKEADRLAENIQVDKGSPVLLKGFGLGYAAEALIRKGHRLIIAEADVIILRAAFSSRDLTDLLNEIQIFAGEEPSRFDEFLRERGLNEGLTELNHNPSVKLNSEFYKKLSGIEIPTPFVERVSVSQGQKDSAKPGRAVPVPKGLKILLPSPLYGGSLPIAGYCRRALEDLGHKVEYFDSSFYYPAYKSVEDITANEDHRSQLKSLYTMFVSELVLAKAAEWKPDLVFGIAQSPFTTNTLAQFKQLKIPIAFWFMEDFRLFTYWKTFAPLYDYFFVIQRGEFSEKLSQLGIRNYHYLPLAADPDFHKPVELTPEEKAEYSSTFSFVGAGYYNRAQFFLQLLNEDFKIWGSDWNPLSPLGRVLQRKGERISPEDCVKIFNAATININLHSSSYHNGINPNGDFVNPRTFEIAACGGFQAVDPRSELGELFEVGREIITFSNVGELRRKKDYYMEHPDEREEIAKAGRQRALAEHTYRHRMQEMLEVVVAGEPVLQRRDENPNIARNLAQAAGDDAELKNLFGQFDQDEELTIDKIAKYIRSGKGELTQTEGVLLLMKEFYDWAREKKVV